MTIKKYINQNREYLKRQLRLQDYHKQLIKKKNSLNGDFNYIKLNFPNFAHLTSVEKLNLKKTTNRYYHNQNYIRFLKRKIELNNV